LQTDFSVSYGTSGIKHDGNPYGVLIVDDSKFVKKQLGKILESEGFKIVSTAAHGAEAVDIYKEMKECIDIVTMDITMPGMDGITAMEKIVQFDSSAKVVMVSALGKQDLVKKSFMLGASNYIVKPLNRDKVLERLSYVLNS
jgi:two-component system, chemotaxis family, chemotaxis protein CheY